MLRVSKVLEVQPNYRVRISLTGGTERVLNLKALIPTSLKSLRDPELFAQVTVVDGTLTWAVAGKLRNGYPYRETVQVKLHQELNPADFQRGRRVRSSLKKELIPRQVNP